MNEAASIVKQDGASTKIQNQNFDMLNYHGDKEVSSTNKPTFTLMVEKLKADYSAQTASHPAGKLKIKHRVDGMTYSTSTSSKTTYFQWLVEGISQKWVPKILLLPKSFFFGTNKSMYYNL